MGPLSLERRVGRLERAAGARGPAPAAPAWDFSCLSPREQDELDQLLAKVGGPRPGSGRADFSRLSDAELDRLAALAERAVPAG